MSMRTPTPIVFAKRLGGVQVKIECPFCKTRKVERVQLCV